MKELGKEKQAVEIYLSIDRRLTFRRRSCCGEGRCLDFLYLFELLYHGKTAPPEEEETYL